MKNVKWLILSAMLVMGHALVFSQRTTPKFTRLAINTRNGGFGLLGEDNKVYVCDFKFDFLRDTKPHPGKYDDIMSFQGQGLGVRSIDKALVYIVPGPENERPFDGNPKGKYIAYDRETQALWYIGLDDLVYKVGGSANDSPSPNIPAKALQVCGGQLFIIGRDDSQMKKYMPSEKGNARWQLMVNGMKVVDMYVDRGVDQIAFITESDKQVLVTHFTPGSVPWPPVTPNLKIKAKAVVEFGGAPFIVAEDGHFYAPVNGVWVKGKLTYL